MMHNSKCIHRTSVQLQDSNTREIVYKCIKWL